MKQLYQCNVCGKIVLRDPMIGGNGKIQKTAARWMESFCEATGKNARLYRLRKRG